MKVILFILFAIILAICLMHAYGDGYKDSLDDALKIIDEEIEKRTNEHLH